MIKVALFAEMLVQDFDGAARTVFQLIDRIDATQYNYLFIYGNGPKDFRGFPSLKTARLHLPLNDDYSISLPALTKRRLYARLDEFSPDVIHITTPSVLGFFALKYAQKNNIPVISIYHTHFLAYIPYYFRHLSIFIKPVSQWMQGAMLRFYNNCQTVYAPTPSMIQELCNIGISKNRIQLWQRGIDLTQFNPAKSQANFLRNITGNRHKNILFVSRLVWEKNLQTLVALATHIRGNRLPYNMIIAGDGAARKDLQRQMPDAFFLGKMDHENLSVLYASADVFVFPSISETYGNVVNEAMASGLPCVIADGGGSADLVAHGYNGYKCAPTDAQAYLMYIETLMHDKFLRDQVRENALQTVARFSWEALAKRYFNDIDELANRNAPSRVWKAS